MRPIAAVVAASLLAAGSVGALLPSMPGVPGLDVLASVDALLAADSWVGRVQALPYAPYAGVDVPVFHEERSVVQLVRDVYARQGWALSLEEEALLEGQVAGLGPELGFALQQLLGAVEVGMGDWERATAAWSVEDWEALRALDPTAHGEPAGVNHILEKADGALLTASALRLLSVLDDVTPLLAGAGVGSSDVALFPGPNEGLLFNDPMNVILVGGPGPSTYRTHTVPIIGLEHGSHVLIIDTGGNDLYLNRAASAHPIPRLVCVNDICHNGFPVSIGIDIGGDDTHTPTSEIHGAIASGSWAGIGLFLDVEGRDFYSLDGLYGGQGKGFARGQALLLDMDGNDVYQMGSAGQGRAQGIGSVGLLFDLRGDDLYSAGGFSQAEGFEGGSAFLVDLDGADSTSAFSYSQGDAFLGAIAMLINIGGLDAYSAVHTVRGSAEGCIWLPGQLIPGVTLNGYCKESTALFIDICGTESYVGWLGSDDAIWQQGNLGRGIDTNSLPVCGSMI